MGRRSTSSALLTQEEIELMTWRRRRRSSWEFCGQPQVHLLLNNCHDLNSNGFSTSRRKNGWLEESLDYEICQWAEWAEGVVRRRGLWWLNEIQWCLWNNYHKRQWPPIFPHFYQLWSLTCVVTSGETGVQSGYPAHRKTFITSQGEEGQTELHCLTNINCNSCIYWLKKILFLQRVSC